MSLIKDMEKLLSSIDNEIENKRAQRTAYTEKHGMHPNNPFVWNDFLIDLDYKWTYLEDLKLKLENYIRFSKGE